MCDITVAREVVTYTFKRHISLHLAPYTLTVWIFNFSPCVNLLVFSPERRLQFYRIGNKYTGERELITISLHKFWSAHVSSHWSICIQAQFLAADSHDCSEAMAPQINRFITYLAGNLKNTFLSYSQLYFWIFFHD